MGVHCLAIVASVMLIAACATSAPSSDDAQSSVHSSPSQRPETSVKATFETTASHRDDARAAGLPVLLRGDALTYPATANRQAIGNGWVELFITVNPDGTVATAQVLNSSHPTFNDAAIIAVRSWQFAPQINEQSFTHRLFVTVPGTDDHYQPPGIDR
ncbi:MAG: TonB family protein [Gammaproteobacteria bacterium]|nr:TonB family protein [Gammaproteobacteria bacterium]